MFKIEKPGIYTDVPAKDYYGDPAPVPSFTQSIGKILLEQSPAHARLEHPRLAPIQRIMTAMIDEPVEPAEKYNSAMAIGNAAHAMLIDRGRDVAEAAFSNFMSKDAKTFRDAPENADKIVILSKHLRRASAMVSAARTCLSQIDWHGAFDMGDGEVVIAWQEGDLWFRSLIDWKAHTVPFCYDFKTSVMSMAPHTIGMLIEKAGWHIQAAMHERGLQILEPHHAGRHVFRFLAQENYPPYCVVPVELDEHWMTMGRKKLDAAITIWRQCMETDRWPGYPLTPITPEYPGYREAAWLQREASEFEEARKIRGQMLSDLSGG